MRSTALFLAAACAAFSLSALAQEPPGRAGRISFVQGEASVYQDPDAGWEQAFVNTPLTSENSVWADRGARAEVEVGATAIRLAEATQLDISRLDDTDLDATVAAGSASVRVRYKQSGEHYLFSSPDASFAILADGLYRLDYDPESGETRFSVLSGRARMRSEGGNVAIGAGRMVQVYGGPSPSYSVTEAAAADSFDHWVQSRDEHWQDANARRYVSPYMTGYQDLDAYGTWGSDPDYGQVWFPTRVDSDWAPYRDGHWTYLAPWGWTWVDAQPWGYAPSHYGRWVYVHNRWGWSPGQRVDRPTWAPALVAWIGGSNLSSKGPAVGWYPLAPWERYEPWYHAGSSYTQRVNQGVRNRPPAGVQREGGSDARHWNRDRGATVVDRNAMIARRPVQQARVPVNVQAIRQQPVVTGAQVAQSLPQRNELMRPRAEARAPAAPPARAQGPSATREQHNAPSGTAAPGKAPAATGNLVARPDFRHEQAPTKAPAPAPARAPVANAPQAAPGKAPANTTAGNPVARFPLAPSREGDRAAQEAQRQQDAQRQQEALRRQQQETQQKQQQEVQQKQAQEKQQQEALQKQQQQAQQKQQQEALQKQQQQAQQKQQQEAQQRQQAEARARESQQQLEKMQRDTQQKQQQQQQQQEQKAREAKQQLEKSQRDAQQQQQQAQQKQQQEALQRQQQEQAKAREAQQQLEKAKREAQQQQQQAQQKQQQEAQQRQQQEQAKAREVQQQLEKAQHDAQQQRAAQQAQKDKEKEKEKEKEKDDKQPH